MNQGFSSFLNFSRWLSAFLVLIHHIRHIVFVDLKDVHQSTFFVKLFYFFTGFGHEAVVIFFVLSGLLVGGLTFDKWLNEEKKLMFQYFIHRFFRIYIVYAPVLVIGYFIDNIGLNYFDDSMLYSRSPQYKTLSLDTIIKDNLGFDVFLCNLFMLQGIDVGVLGSNGPLWSLSYEWWYYCLWGAFLGVFFFNGSKRFIYLVFCLFVVIFLPEKILLWMVIWLLGVFSYFLAKKEIKFKVFKYISVFVFIALLTVSRFDALYFVLDGVSGLYIDFLTDFLLGVSYGFVLICFYGVESYFSSSFNSFLASFSYSLYLVHFPFIVFVVAVLNQLFGVGFLLQPDYYSYLYFICLSVFLLLLSYFIYYITERHTKKIIQFFSVLQK